MHSPRSSASMFSLILAATFCASLTWFFTQRFEERTLPSQSPPTFRAAFTNHVALVVLDGLRDDRFLATMPKTAARAHDEGTYCAVTGPELSFTAAGVYSLATGDLATPSILPRNFSALPAAVDSLPASAFRAGLRTRLFGERLWSDLFGAYAEGSDTQRDSGPYVQHAPSSWLSFEESLTGGTCQLCIDHDAQFDAIGHRSGPRSAEYGAYAAGIDELLDRLAAQNSGVTWLVTSDHGMLDSGAHGGAEPLARASFLAAYGPGIRRGPCPQAKLAQADIPMTAAVLLGVAFPFLGHGTVPDVVAGMSAGERLAVSRELRDQKCTLRNQLADRYGNGTVRAASDTAEECLEEVHALQATGCRWRMTLALALSLASALGLSWTIGRKWVVSAAAAVVVLVLATFSTVFSNVVYPAVSYNAALGVQLAALALALTVARMAQAFTEDTRRWRHAMPVILGLALTSESHFVPHAQCLVIGLCAYHMSAGRSPWLRWALTIGCLLSFLLVTELCWLRLVSLRTLPDSPAANALASATIGLFGAAAFARSSARSVWSRKGALLTAAYVFSTTYLLTLAAPSWSRPWLILLVVVAALCEVRLAGTLSKLDAVMAGFLLLYALQMSPALLVVLLLMAMLAVLLVRGERLDRPYGHVAGATLRGSLLIAFGYGFCVAEGNHLSFADIHVLAGFLGGALALHLPLTVALVGAYYAAPLVLAIALWARSTEDLPKVVATVRAVHALCALRIVLLSANFLWGGLAEGSWSMQLTDAALCLVWFVASAILALLLPSWGARPVRASSPATRSAYPPAITAT